MNPTIYIGCDAHKSACYFSAMNTDGKIVWEGKRPSTREGFENLAEKFKDYDSRIVLESSGFIWPIVDILAAMDFKVAICNPSKNPSIGKSRKKTDVEDARKLAELLRVGYLQCIYIPTREQRHLRILARERYNLVKLRTRLKNQSKSAEFDHQKERRKRLIEGLTAEIKLLENGIAAEVKSNDCASLIKTTPGLADFGSLLVVGEICSIDRFPRCRKFLAYCGLVPSVRQSGNTVHMGAIRKDSNSRLRWIYVQAAWHAVRKDPEMTKLFNRKAKDKGARKAIVIIARKLATRNYWMLKNGMTYTEVSALKRLG